jgi:ATP-dependent protease HslVU (ClpYQ) peptidase subunit
MTTIVGVRDGGTVYIGGDSGGTAGTVIERMATPKVYATAGYVFGVTGHYFMTNILQHGMEWPSIPDWAYRHEPERFVYTEIIPRLKALVSERMPEHKDEKPEWEILLGFNMRLFQIDDFLSVMEVEKYTALGSGTHVALGSLYSTQGAAHNPLDRVLVALHAAREHTLYTRPPFSIGEAKRDKTSVLMQGYSE